MARRVGLVTLAYNEERFIRPFLKHIPSWVEEKLVLLSATPWNGGHELPDKTDEIAREMGATVLVYSWQSEEEQRNAGQEYFSDKDWIITLDPDEFLDEQGWESLRNFIDSNPISRAFVCERQYTYWKNGYRIDPLEDYRQIILAKPGVRFTDKRVVNTAWGYAPVNLHHMSWARTDEEVKSKIAHYSHSGEFDRKKWLEEIWEKWTPEMEDLHPLTPEALKRTVPATLPKELARLKLWPR